MAARQARRNVALIDDAKDELERFRRRLAVRLNTDVTYSKAIVYAIRRTEAVDAYLDEMDGPIATELEAAVQLRMEGGRE